ncbi:HAD family hydrolase [Streptomyces albospinus]|uniref:HAD family hydrolase n=1 Tax=Streptomyces albospinus TaxID=285515 RepID=UPI001E4DF0ED|nr:HAD family hydrolase [Streptomyces albospinus]
MPRRCDALGKAQADGWTCVIVTNGRTVQQEAKIRDTGLDQLVQGWVISEDVGHKKPEPEIFQAAAATVSPPCRARGSSAIRRTPTSRAATYSVFEACG